MRIVVATRLARPPVLAVLQAQEGLDVVEVEDAAAAVPHLAGADVLVVADPRGAEAQALAAGLNDPACTVRWIQGTSAGMDGLFAQGVPAHIQVTNQGGAVAPVVAEHALAMVVFMARRFDAIFERRQRHEWDNRFAPSIVSLEGRTAVVVGFGHIGRNFARRAQAFDMQVVGVSRRGLPDPLAQDVYPVDRLHEALARADVAVLCAASTPETHRLMDAAAFAAMKRGAHFVNVSRGRTVDQAALKAALESGQLGAAAIDVATPEPLPADDPLWSAPNLLISPHCAGSGSAATGRRIARTLSDNLQRFRRGEPLQHVVTA